MREALSMFGLQVLTKKIKSEILDFVFSVCLITINTFGINFLSIQVAVKRDRKRVTTAKATFLFFWFPAN